MSDSQRKWALIGVALLIFAGVKFWLINTYLARQHSAPTLLRCADLNQGCPLADGVSLRFLRPARHGQHFPVQLAGWPANSPPPGVEFAMAGMDMGSARFPLRDQGHGRWQADIMLPVCVTGRQDWLLLLDLHGKRLQVDFVAGPK